MKIKLITILFLLMTLFLSPVVALAADGTTGSAGGLIPCGNNVNGVKDPCTLCHFIIGFQNLVNFMLKLVVTVAFVGIFVSGVLYIISSGDDGMMTTAKKALTASLIGFAIVMGAWLIVNVVLWVFSADIGMQPGKSWNEFSC
ncbi:MAG: hypothetical protein UT50_C0017G0015 [Candidatus Moranbacteria bacterium GW2011_GWA2_39_41]|nr:MAG: hypothetical protein UT50_C0017G0015 [Candidatus Moranbacteria bacterium GW2011_GWA2_39_41]